MKSRRRAVPRRPGLVRFVGYGGSVLLVLAAGGVLVLPLVGGDGGAGAATGRRAAGAQAPAGSANGAAGTTPGTGGAAQPGNTPDPNRDPLGQQGGGAYGGAGEGDPMPLPTGGPRTYCPDGLGTATYGVDGLKVTIRMQGAAFVQVEVHLRGLDSRTQTTQIGGGRPHTFTFRDVPADGIERIQVRSMGSTVPQTCDLRLG